MLFLTTFPATLSGVMTILSLNSQHQLLGRGYIPEGNTKVQKKESLTVFLSERRSTLGFHLLCGNI